MSKRKYESVRDRYGSKQFEDFEDGIMKIKKKNGELKLSKLDPFAANSEWWFPSIVNPLTPWNFNSRDGILDANPMSKELIQINQHIITVDSQQAECSKGSKYTMLQRWYCEFFCRNSAQARKIAKAMGKVCYVCMYIPGSPPMVIGDPDNVPVTIGVYSKKVEEFTSLKGLDFGNVFIEEAKSQNSLLAGKVYSKKEYPLLWICARKYPKPSSTQLSIPTEYIGRSGKTTKIPFSPRTQEKENTYMWKKLLHAIQK